jgi:hypothetical protein
MENNQNANVQANAQVVQTTTTTPQNNNVGGNSNVNYDEVFKKLDSILDKRSDGIAKSALKDNGYEDDEMKEILSQYRASKQAKANETDNTITTLQAENEALKKTIRQEKLNNEALTQARALNVDDKTIPYLIKLADFKDAFDEKGVIASDKVKTALETVLNDVPSLKAKEDNGTKGVTVGADTSNGSQPSGNMFNFGFAGVRKH